MRGRNQMTAFPDPLTNKGVEYWYERVMGVYGPDGGVDIEVIDDQLALTTKTAEYIYSAFTPLEIRYVRGSRPMLEKVVQEVVSSGMSDRQKALALMRRVRDNRDMGLASPSLFMGGSEEDLLKRGAIMCNEVSRLYVCLCQVAGIPARLHCAHISGHMMTEVYAGGKWGWVDPMMGVAAVLDDGRPASVWELFQDPMLFERQPANVWSDCRPWTIVFGHSDRDPQNVAYRFASFRSCYFHPREAQAIGNYFVWDHSRYSYPWRIDMHDQVRLVGARINEQRNRKALGWPDFYYSAYLFNEQIQPRPA